MFEDKKRHEFLIQAGQLLNQCHGCKAWQEACRHTHNPNTICNGCTIYEKLRGLGYMLSTGDREEEKVKVRCIRRAFEEGRTRYWVIHHMNVSRSKAYQIYNHIHERVKVNG